MKSKFHPILSSISQELRGLRVNKDFEVFGHTYTLALLSPKEEDWVAEMSSSATNNVIEYATKSSKARIAAALVKVDNLSMAELFLLPDEPDMSQERKNYLRANAGEFSRWLKEQVYDFVCNDLDSEVITTLDLKYMTLEEEKRKALKDIGPLSKRTPLNV